MHVGRARDGDPASVEWLVERLSPLLRAQAAYRLRGRIGRFVEPDDVVQEVWIRALPRLPGLPDRDGRHTPVLMAFLGTTLLQHVNNLLAKYLRGKPSASAEPLEALSAETIGCVTRATRKEGTEQLSAAIEELDEADREILVLRSIEQRTVAEVAASLGLQEGAVRMRHHRAISRLRAKVPRSVFDELDGQAEESEAPD